MINIFKSKILRKLLYYFLFGSSRKNYVNAIAKEIGEEAKNTHTYLIKLEKQGLLNSEFVGNQRFFTLNKEAPFLTEYRSLFNKAHGIEELLKKALSTVYGVAEAYIYGDCANGLMDSSKIELLIIGNHDFINTLRILNEAEKKISRNISIQSLTPEEFDEKRSTEDPSLTKIFEHRTIKIL